MRLSCRLRSATAGSSPPLSTRKASTAGGPDTDVIEERGLTVVPGFIDTHSHLIFAGYSAYDVPVDGARSIAQLVVLLRARGRDAAPPPMNDSHKPWISSRGLVTEVHREGWVSKSVRPFGN